MPGNRDLWGPEAGIRQHRVTGVAGDSTNFRRCRATGDARKSENEFQRTPGRPGFGRKRRETEAFRSAGKPEALEKSGKPEISEEGGKARATGRERQLRERRAQACSSQKLLEPLVVIG